MKKNKWPLTPSPPLVKGMLVFFVLFLLFLAAACTSKPDPGWVGSDLLLELKPAGKLYKMSPSFQLGAPSELYSEAEKRRHWAFDPNLQFIRYDSLCGFIVFSAREVMTDNDQITRLDISSDDSRKQGLVPLESIVFNPNLLGYVESRIDKERQKYEQTNDYQSLVGLYRCLLNWAEDPQHEDRVQLACSAAADLGLENRAAADLLLEGEKINLELCHEGVSTFNPRFRTGASRVKASPTAEMIAPTATAVPLVPNQAIVRSDDSDLLVQLKPNAVIWKNSSFGTKFSKEEIANLSWEFQLNPETPKTGGLFFDSPNGGIVGFRIASVEQTPKVGLVFLSDLAGFVSQRQKDLVLEAIDDYLKGPHNSLYIYWGLIRWEDDPVHEERIKKACQVAAPVTIENTWAWDIISYGLNKSQQACKEGINASGTKVEFVTKLVQESSPTPKPTLTPKPTSTPTAVVLLVPTVTPEDNERAKQIQNLLSLICPSLLVVILLIACIIGFIYWRRGQEEQKQAFLREQVESMRRHAEESRLRYVQLRQEAEERLALDELTEDQFEKLRVVTIPSLNDLRMFHPEGEEAGLKLCIQFRKQLRSKTISKK